MPSAAHRGALRLVLAMGLVLVAACGDDSSAAERGFTIGLITNNPNGLRNVRGFTDRMHELGYVDGDNVVYLFAGEPTQGADLDRELRRFVDADVDLVFTAGTPTGVAAHRITAGTDIPVVFGVIADPLAAGVMDDLSRPGGNMTGVKLGLSHPRRMELLKEIVPTVETVWVPYNPDDSAGSTAVDQIAPVADQLGIELVLAEARTDADVSAALASLSETIDAVFLVPDSLVNARLSEILDRATGLSVPTSGPSTAQVADGAVMTYGFIHERAGAQAARIADQILRGADPGDLPVEDTESYLALNLAAADEIGLEISDATLRQAAQIVRDGDRGDR